MAKLRDKIREEIRQRYEREDHIRTLAEVSTFPDDAPLEALKPALSARAYNCLRNDDMQTVGQIRNMTVKELLRIPNLGYLSAAEITRVVNGGHDWNFDGLRKYLAKAPPKHAVQIAIELEKLLELAKEAAWREG